MKIKRIISLALAASMLFAGLVFGGCNNDPKQGEVNNTSIPNEIKQEDVKNTSIPNEPKQEEVKNSPLPVISTGSGKIEKVAEAKSLIADYPKNPDGAFDKDPFMSGEVEKYDQMEAKWEKATEKRMEIAKSVPTMSKFANGLVSEALKHSDGGNLVMSPANIYMGLAMLAETAGGETRTEILKALDVESIEKLRENCDALMKAESVDDGLTKTVLANSLWMNDGIEFNKETLNTIAEKYYASSYWGDPASESFGKAMKEWLDEQTGGLLKDSIECIEIPPELILGIASTIYMKANWQNEFEPYYTDEETFHAPTGDIECDFMHGKFGAGGFYKGDNYAAVALPLKNDSGNMWFLLPDEGTTVNEMLENGGMAFMLSDKSEAESDWMVNVSLPKLDVDSDSDIVEILKSMGITRCFTSEADFTPLTSQGAFVSNVKHAARVKTDEEGMEAAAYIEIYLGGNASYNGQKEFDFIADRPFVFCVTGVSDAPLFVGVVNTPIN